MISLIIGTLGTLAKAFLKRKEIKAEGKAKLAQAKIDGKVKREQARADSNAKYNVEVAKGMQASWKDELFVIVWLSILLSCFIPWTQPYVKDGFIFLAAYTPYWFEYCLIGMVVASFGLKGWKIWKQ